MGGASISEGGALAALLTAPPARCEGCLAVAALVAERGRRCQSCKYPPRSCPIRRTLIDAGRRLPETFYCSEWKAPR